MGFSKEEEAGGRVVVYGMVPLCYSKTCKLFNLLWLAIQNRLTTGDRLVAWGYKGDTRCMFCRNAALVLGYGELACSGVMFLTLSLIGSK